MKRPSICSFAMAAIMGIAASAASAAEPLSAFYGKIQGGAALRTTSSIYFGVTARDFDVTIGPAEMDFPWNGQALFAAASPSR